MQQVSPLRFIGNVTPEDAQKIKNQYIIGEPQKVNKASVNELKKAGIVGLYEPIIPKSSAIHDGYLIKQSLTSETENSA